MEIMSGKNLYESVADHIIALIKGGTLRVGDRVPSVRHLSQQQQVSISTVLQAYRVLENRGWIEARPQSGYYVLRTQHVRAPEPEVSQPQLDITPVEVKELIRQFYHAAQQPGIIQMGAAIGTPTNFPSRQLARAASGVARQFRTEGNSYDLPPGNFALRTQIAKRAMESGCQLTPNDIIITTGCTEALNLCLRALAQPGEVILIESPTYLTTLQIIESLGLRTLEIPTHPREGIDLSTLEYVLEREKIAACLLMPGVHNPLGCSMPIAHIRQLVKLLAAHDIPLIEDDVWGDTYFGESRPPTAKSFDTSGSVLLCSSFSKTIAPGYRIGWVAPGRYFQEVEYLKFVSSLANPSLPSLAIAEFLENGGYDHHLRRLRRHNREKVLFMTELLERYFPEGTRITRPIGGEVVWVELPGKINTTHLFTRALREGICIGPGSIFSAKGKYTNCLRLYCGHHEPDITQKAIQQLATLM